MSCTNLDLKKKARGRILFKFDPNHKRPGPDGKEVTEKKAAMWAEDTAKLRHDDTWDSREVKS